MALMRHPDEAVSYGAYKAVCDQLKDAHREIDRLRQESDRLQVERDGIDRAYSRYRQNRRAEEADTRTAAER